MDQLQPCAPLAQQTRVLRELSEPMLREAGIAPGMRVLDADCGDGAVAVIAAAIVGPRGRVIGVDRSTGAIRNAALRAAQSGLTNLLFMRREPDQLELDALADAVIGRGPPADGPDCAAAHQRCLQRHVRPGGLLLLLRPGDRARQGERADADPGA